METILIPDGFVKCIALENNTTVKKIRYKQLQELLRKAIHDAYFLKVEYTLDDNEKKYFYEERDKIYRALTDEEGYKKLYKEYEDELVENLIALKKYNEFFFPELLRNVKNSWNEPILHIPDGFVKYIAIENNMSINKIQYRQLQELFRTALYDTYSLRVEYTLDENEKEIFFEQGDEIYRVLTNEEEYREIYNKYKEQLKNSIMDLKNYNIFLVLNILIDTKKRWNRANNIQSIKDDIIQDM